MAVACFWLEPVDQAIAGLRRYRSLRDGGACPLPMGYHDAIADLGTAPIHRVADPQDGRVHWGKPEFAYPGHDDPRWPARCGCGYEFQPDDQWQDWSEVQYRRADNGELTTLRRAPDGAMWDAWWMPGQERGEDGRCLVVKCPGGHEWMIDGRASNCTLPQDTQHRCWIRHGEPPLITVDKDGKTCAAGAGSIQAGDYHGFLRGGVFT